MDFEDAPASPPPQSVINAVAAIGPRRSRSGERQRADAIFGSATALFAILALFSPPFAADAAESARVASKPLYRDPIFDGAADPVVVWNPHLKRWWMFYTNRRANVPGLPGVAWVHGTKIGLAESTDEGVTWKPAGAADIALPSEIAGAEPTLWAPDVVTESDGTHHMFLTVVPGVFEDWAHPRRIVHLTSPDLRGWTYVAELKLASDRVIDACVKEMPGGGWRMWYNNERDGKSIYYADSRDLKTWTDRGKVASIRARGEGPYVFTWRGRHWMLVDTWTGLGVYRSRDMDTWEQQPTLLLDRPGRGADDGVVGGHAGVVVSGPRAFCFYFTHPGRTPANAKKDSPETRRSSIQVVELVEQDGWLRCERDPPVQVALAAPDGRRGSSAEPAATERAPADAARLRAAGSRDIRAHDPSTLAYSNGEYWLFHTGRGVPTWRSKDLLAWEAGPPVFRESPPWVAEAVPENRNSSFWAPDIIKLGERYLLYYSVLLVRQTPLGHRAGDQRHARSGGPALPMAGRGPGPPHERGRELQRDRPGALPRPRRQAVDVIRLLLERPEAGGTRSRHRQAPRRGAAPFAGA